MQARISRSSILLACLAGAAGLAAGVALGRTSYPPLDALLSGGETVIGQEIAYPRGRRW